MIPAVKQSKIDFLNTINQETQKTSTLRKIPKPPTSTCMLSHIQADFYIHGAPGQEGNDRLKSFEVMLYMLQTLPPKLMTPALEQLIQEFDFCHAMAIKEKEDQMYGHSALLTTQRILEEVKKLEEGKRFLFFGGWDASGVGATGHAMMHTIEKQGDGKYTLMTFNTGAGLSAFHDYQVDRKGYRRYKPVVVYKDIEEARLFQTNHLLSLIDLRHCPLSKRDSKHGAEIIYESILPAFGGKAVSASSDLIQAMRAQRSGICTWKVLKSKLKQAVDPKNYKAICLHIRLQDLKDYVNDKKKKGIFLTDSQNLHLTNDVEKFIRELAKEGHGLDFEEKQQYVAEIAALRKTIASCIPKKSVEFKSPFTGFKTGEIQSLGMSSCSQSLKDSTVSMDELNSRIAISLSTEPPKAEQLVSHLEECTVLCETLYQNAQYNELILFVNTLIRNLPFPIKCLQGSVDSDLFWGSEQGRTDAEITRAICLLGKLNELFFQSCFRVQKSHGTEMVTATTTYCMQIKLLETLLQFKRSHPGDCLMGLSQRFPHEASYLHINAIQETHLVVYDLFLSTRVKQCVDFVERGWGFDGFIDLLLQRRLNNVDSLLKSVGDQKKLGAMGEAIKQRAIDKKVFVKDESEQEVDQIIDYSLLTPLLYADLGQFGLAPDFLVSLNKQMFITSYFLANGDFTTRGPGSEKPDAFTLDTLSWQEIASRKDPWERNTASIWVKGMPKAVSKRVHSVSEVEDKAYQEIANPEIRSVVRCIIDRRRYEFFYPVNPNDALTTYQEYTHLSSKDAQELVTLANTPPQMILWQALSFFSRSIDKLQSRDYQLLFEFCVLPYLEGEIENNPQSLKNFFRFLESGLEEFRAPSQIDAFLFLIRVGMYVEALAKKDRSHWLEKLIGRLDTSGNEAEKRAIEAQIAYTLVATSAEVTQENVFAILKGLSHMQSGQIPLSMKEPRVLQPVLQWLYQSEKQIQKMDAQILCAAVLPTQGIQWKGTFPLYVSHCGQYRVNILTGVLSVQQASAGALPQAILHNHTFSSLFGPACDYKVRIEDFRRFYFTEKDHEFRVELLTKGDVAIAQKRGNQWFFYFPLDGIPFWLPLSMRESYTHWISEDGKELLIQDADFNLCFLADPLGIHPSDHPGKTLARPQVFWRTCFTRFENAGFMQGWLDESDQVKEVVLPRYGLRFALQEGVFASKEFPGYFVAKEQDLPHVPFATSYLILENEKGEKKALFPLETLVAEPTSEEFLKPPLTMKFNEPFVYLAIDLTKKGRPKHLTQQQAINLAYLAIAHKDYGEADRFLKIAEGLSAINTEDFIQPFCTFVKKSHDNHPKALALTLRIGMLALNNLRYKHKASDQSAERRINALLKDLYKVYCRYHAVDANVGDEKLPLQSERTLLQEFFNQGLLTAREFDRFLYLHHGKDLEVTSKKADGLDINLEEEIVKDLNESMNWSYFFSTLKKWSRQADLKIWAGKESLTDRPLTRPGPYFIPYFLNVCLHVEEYRKDPESQAELHYYLQFIKWTQYNAFFRDCLLEIVHDEGNHYTEYLKQLQLLFQKNASQDDISEWICHLAEHYHALYKLKDHPARRKPSFPPILPLQLPEKARSPSLKTVSSPKNEPLYPSDQLETLFETAPLDAGERLPDIASDGVEKHQKVHIDTFNENKKTFYQSAKPASAYKLRDPEQFELDLIDAISVGKEVLRVQADYLCSLAKDGPKDPQRFLAWKLEMEGFQKKPLTIEDLIDLYKSGSEAEIFKRCPGFENKSKYCKMLLGGVKKYLESATAQQQRKRALKWVQELRETSAKEPSLDRDKEVENINAELYATLSAVREYDTSLHPNLLVFEYRTNKLLRKDQYALFERLTDSSKEPAETEVIEQLIMGAGKTKVVLPLLGAENADGEKLFFVVVPSFNYETNRLDLKEISLGALRQEPLSFQFDRSTPFTEAELRRQLWNLQNAILYRTYVVTTPESLVCVKLKYRELLYLIGEGQLQLEEMEPKWRLFLEIVQLIKKGCAVLDEADTILNVRREVNFPLGTYRTIPEERIHLVKKIYEVLLKEEMEPWTHLKENKPEIFVVDHFYKEVAPAIVAHLIKDWASDLIAEEDLKQFLLGQLEDNELKGLSEHPQRDLISLAKEMIVVFIPTVLKKKGNEGFGLSQTTNKKYPIPYVGNNTPDETSEFGNIYETLLYAAHIYFQNGLQEIHIDELIQETCLDIRLESKDLQCPYVETPSFKTFTATYGVKDPFAITPADRKTLAAVVKKDHQAVFHWLSNFVYPDVRYTLQKINANAMTLINMLAHVQGFTGTPYNRLTYHNRLQKPDFEKRHSSPEDELRILHAMYQKVKEGGLEKLKASTPIETLEEILEDMQFDCLIDVGALLNGISNQTVAETIRTRMEKEELEGTIYFNEKNEIVIWLKGEPKPIHFSEGEWGRVITYLDQRHTAGVDITQRPTAKAKLTFGGRTIIRDLTQGGMRMRKLLSSHNIGILIPPELGMKISTFDELLLYAIINQANRVADDLVSSTKMKLRDIIRDELDLLILSLPQLIDQVKLQKFLQAQMIDLSRDDPYLEFGMCFHLGETLTILGEYRNKQMALVQELMEEKSLKQCDQHLQQAFLRTAKIILEKLKDFSMPPAEFLASEIPRLYAGQEKNNSLVEIEKEIEREVEAAVKRYNEKSKSYELWGTGSKTPLLDALFFTPDRTDSPKNCPLVKKVSSLLKSDVFDEALCTTQLFSQAVVHQKDPLFGNGSQKHCYQLLFVVEPDGTQRGILMDPAEMSRVRMHMHKDTVQGRAIYLVDLATGSILEQKGELTKAQQEKFALLQVQAKFFNGELIYTKKEWEHLKQWISVKGTKSMRETLEKIISSYLGLTEKYQSSELRKYLIS
jgi:Protein of unknown function (DUF3638)